MSPARRKPHCQTCGTPMAGHLRPHGVPVCPSLPSPPPSPPTSPNRKLGTKLLKTVTSLSDIPVPPDGHYRRKNPNWRSPERVPGDSGYEYNCDRSSLVPTLLVDDDGEEEDSKARVQRFRMQVALDEERDDTERALRGESSFDDDSISVRGSGGGTGTAPIASGSNGVVRVAQALTGHPSLAAVRSLFAADTTPAAGLYPTAIEDISLVQRGARKLGLHVGVMHKPRSARPPRETAATDVPAAADDFLSARDGKPRGRALARDPSWWMVVGQDQDAVDHLMDLQREHVASGLDPSDTPGGVGLQVVPYNAGTPRGLVFSQLVLASALGGLIMFYGLSSL